MAKKYLDGDGLLYLWQKITNQFVKKDGTKVLSTNDYTTDEKNKLAGLEAGATKTIIDTELSATSTNPVQNKVINTALAGKVNTVSGKGLSTNDLTDDLLNKLNNTATKVEEIATVGGEPNIIETVKVNGEILDVTDKTVDIVIPESDQADWSQNDETAASYVKNRPFYEASTDYVILDEAERTTVMDSTVERYAIEYPSEMQTLINNFGDEIITYKLTINDEYLEGSCKAANGSITLNSSVYGSVFINGYRILFVSMEESMTATIKLIVSTPGEVVKIDEKFLPDTVVFEDELVQSDWNQNDETAPDYIKNRICYEEESTVTVFENLAVTLGNLDGETTKNRYYFTDDETTLYKELIDFDAEEAIIVWDGISYDVTGSYLMEHDSHSFRIEYDEGAVRINPEYLTVYPNDGVEVSTDHTLSIYVKGGTTVVKIDEKFLPDTVVLESELTSKNYQNETQVNTLIANAIGDITGISYEIVTSLPETGEAGVIYLISNNGANPNIYDEYIYTNGAFEKIGTTDVDLSGYVQDSDLVAITNSEIDTLIAG